MGKGLLILLAGSLIGGSIMLMQAQRTSLETDNQQSKHQEKVLAREIARSAYNSLSSRAREMEREGKKRDEIVETIGDESDPVVGSYRGGQYLAWLQKIPGSSYRVVAQGSYGEASYSINGGRGHTVEGALEVPALCENGCTLTAEFIESQAGYCSAVYLQRMIPKDGGTVLPGETVDSETEEYYALEPEIVFTPGNNRNGTDATFSKLLRPVTRMNFILAVDADYTCEEEGEDLDIDDSFYEHRRNALVENTEDLTALQEGVWAMAEEHADADEKGTWRIAFEDLPDSRFSDLQLRDIKENGYPDNDSEDEWNATTRTYGGQGWSYQSNGYLDLDDYGNVPDFSDQVFEVTLDPQAAAGGGGTPADNDD